MPPAFAQSAFFRFAAILILQKFWEPILRPMLHDHETSGHVQHQNVLLQVLQYRAITQPNVTINHLNAQQYYRVPATCVRNYLCDQYHQYTLHPAAPATAEKYISIILTVVKDTSHA